MFSFRTLLPRSHRPTHGRLSLQADDDRAAIKETQEAIAAKTIELDDLKARHEELIREDRSRRAQLEQERDARLVPLRDEVINLKAALKAADGPAARQGSDAGT